MSNYILDTNILVGYLRGAGYAKYVEKEYKVSTPPNISFISVVTIGESLSLSVQWKWGEDKTEALQELINKIPSIDINHPEIFDIYAEIDAYSQGKHPTKSLPQGMSSRNMGKNDIWIASTASVLNATLLTTDKNFEHLNNIFLKVIYISPKSNAGES